MMEERSRNEVSSPQLLDLIPKEREWQKNRTEGGKSSEERKLELRLGPPGEEDQWNLSGKPNNNPNTDSQESLLSLGYFSSTILNNSNGFQSKNLYSSKGYPNKGSSSFLQFQTSQMGKDTSQAKVVELQNNGGGDKNKGFSLPSSANTAVINNSQKRTAPGPVVGWPPIRSFRKNLATTSNSTSKVSSPESQNQHDNNKVAGKKPVENYGKGLFVKINMDGVPIGRKVDLNAYDSYDNLSTAVDELFRGLLAAQKDSSVGGVNKQQLEEEKAITGLLDGSGEYTLVYEDNEGDRMLVGDVPWHMFVSTVKRLRVLKSSELSAFTLGRKVALDSAMK